jgi:hypothetical protein
VKKAKLDNIDIERARALAREYPQLANKLFSVPMPGAIARRKRRKRKQPETQEGTIVGRIEKEIKGSETAEDVRPFRDFILEPLPELSWTKDLAGYEDARLSAENAMRRIFASTRAAGAGFEAGHPESVLLEVFFYKVRNGLIQADNPKILQLLQYAQQVGKTQAYLFIARLADELKNARKRVPGAPQFSEIRARLVGMWVRSGFWLMSDDLIARIAHVGRQAVAKAVKELELVKHRDTKQRPIVKGLGEDSRFVFREGYPPKS